MTITSLNIAEGTVGRRCMPKIQRKYIVILVVIIVLCVSLVIAYFSGAFKKGPELRPPNPTEPLPPSPSVLHRFRRAAVCVDSIPCAEVGKNVLEKNGSVVDAALAAMFCNGVVNMHSMGLGGGFLMTIYIRENRTAYTLDAREAAPLTISPELYKNSPNKSKNGILAAGVPGELRGYWAAHQKFGKLSWKEVIQPTIELCEKGYKMSKAQAEAIPYSLRLQDPNLKEWFAGKTEGMIIKPQKLCDTLKIIAEKGAEAFYNGSIGKLFLEDVQNLGGLITQADFDNYTARWVEPIVTELRLKDHLYAVPPPSSGVLVGFILEILGGYNFTRASIDGIDNTILTYHRTIEAFKFAFAQRTKLGDPAFANITTLLENLTSNQYAEAIRKQITDNSTFNDPKHYGAVFDNVEDHGTAHISVLAQNGDAVSVTSTVNLYFGAGITSEQTGILLNSGLDDFSLPGFKNFFGLPGAPNNEIAPGKRSMSSMSPVIITDKNGEVKLVIGASGGTKIISAVAMTIMRILWFGQNVKEAVDAARLHHQLFPMMIEYEYGMLQELIDRFEGLGHKTSRYSTAGSIICALFKDRNFIYANADFRKGGDVFGID